MDDAPWYETIPMPALLRHARTTYGRAMRDSLAESGYDDLPANGLYVIGALARGETPLADVIEELGVSKQAGGQLVDTLVLRGYLERTVDDADRRRLTISLTERGQAAAAAQAAGRARIDTELEARVGADNITQTRATLAAMIDLRRPPPT
jgi:DNA-binding MarR family transcriptional regulator